MTKKRKGQFLSAILVLGLACMILKWLMLAALVVGALFVVSISLRK